jgi:DNA-directed RNA polymerase subunit RPC12/RpoP
MTVIASSVAALNLLRKYKCPHCGAEQQRVLPKEDTSLECSNCLKAFSPAANQVERRKARKRRR